MDVEQRPAFVVFAFLWKSPFLIRFSSPLKTHKNFSQSKQNKSFFLLYYIKKKVIYLLSMDYILNVVSREAYALNKSIS